MALFCGLGLAWGYWQGRDRLEAEKRAALEREAEQKSRTLHEAQELVTQLLVEMRPKFQQAGHPEWIEEAEQRVAAFPWDLGGAERKAWDPRRYRGRAALVKGELLSSQGQWSNALRAFHEAIGQLKTLVPEQPEALIFREELARARVGECLALIKLGYHKESYRAGIRALEILEPTTGQEPSPAVMDTMVDAACLMMEVAAQRKEHAASALEVATRLLERLPGSDPDHMPAQEAEWHSRLQCRATPLTAWVKSPEEADQTARKAVAAARRLVTLTSGGELSSRLLASALVAWSEVAILRKAPDEATAFLTEATETLARVNPASSASLDPVFVAVARAWERSGEWIAVNRHANYYAMQANDQAIELWERLKRAGHRSTPLAAISHLRLCNVHLARDVEAHASVIHYAAKVVRGHELSRRNKSDHLGPGLDALEAVILLLEINAPDRCGKDPSWNAVLAQTQVTLAEKRPRKTVSQKERRLALEPRLLALAPAPAPSSCYTSAWKAAFLSSSARTGIP